MNLFMQPICSIKAKYNTVQILEVKSFCIYFMTVVMDSKFQSDLFTLKNYESDLFSLKRKIYSMLLFTQNWHFLSRWYIKIKR